jgi:hypothetical protein
MVQGILYWLQQRNRKVLPGNMLIGIPEKRFYPSMLAAAMAFVAKLP